MILVVNIQLNIKYGTIVKLVGPYMTHHTSLINKMMQILQNDYFQKIGESKSETEFGCIKLIHGPLVHVNISNHAFTFVKDGKIV